MNNLSCQRGMPERTASLSARRERKNDVDIMSNCQPSHLIASADEKSTDVNQEPAEAPLGRDSEGRIDFVHSAGIQDDDLLPDASSRCLQVCHISERGYTGWSRDGHEMERLS
jgi:hypothetical protein